MHTSYAEGEHIDLCPPHSPKVVPVCLQLAKWRPQRSRVSSCNGRRTSTPPARLDKLSRSRCNKAPRCHGCSGSYWKGSQLDSFCLCVPVLPHRGEHFNDSALLAHLLQIQTWSSSPWKTLPPCEYGSHLRLGTGGEGYKAWSWAGSCVCSHGLLIVFLEA